MTKLPGTQVDSTVLPVLCFHWTPSDSRFCPLESGREYWTCVEAAGRAKEKEKDRQAEVIVDSAVAAAANCKMK